jgi:Flp pilus assembly protein TadD
MQKVVKLVPDMSGAHSNLGQVLEAAGRVKEAEGAYLRAHQLQPSLSGPLSSLCALHMKEVGRRELHDDLASSALPVCLS